VVHALSRQAALWTSRSPTESVGATLAVGKLNYEYPLVNENLGLALPEALRARASRKQGRVVSCIGSPRVSRAEP